jgi:hypothetical protein
MNGHSGDNDDSGNTHSSSSSFIVIISVLIDVRVHVESSRLVSFLLTYPALRCKACRLMTLCDTQSVTAHSCPLTPCAAIANATATTAATTATATRMVRVTLVKIFNVNSQTALSDISAILYVPMCWQWSILSRREKKCRHASPNQQHRREPGSNFQLLV